jgi:hypothetical protein
VTEQELDTEIWIWWSINCMLFVFIEDIMLFVSFVIKVWGFKIGMENMTRTGCTTSKLANQPALIYDWELLR